MSYNQQAEMFSRAASRPFPKMLGVSVPKGWSCFDQVYSDIADATPTDKPFRPSELVGELPTIAHLADKTQREIVAVVVRDMQALPADCDGLTRVRGGVYQWRFAPDQ